MCDANAHTKCTVTILIFSIEIQQLQKKSTDDIIDVLKQINLLWLEKNRNRNSASLTI